MNYTYGVLGIVIGLLAILALYVVTMLFYFWVRKKHPHSKFLIELLFIVGVFLVGVCIKVAVAWQKHPETELVGSVSNFFYTAYMSVGSFGFGSLPVNLEDKIDALLLMIYFGSSFYVSLISVSLIGARISYELFSYMRLRFPEGKKNIYVFTALTEESLTFAESIKAECELKNKPYVIVFGGPSLKAFDRKNALCRRVMANGFCYWTYAAKKDKSIASALHLNNRNKDFKNETDKLDFMIFAFDAEDHIPQEEENLDLVLEDVKTRNKKKDNLFIDYFILTKRKINYQAYQRAINEILPKNDGKCSVINLWSEAQEVARTTVRSILDLGLKETLCEKEEKPISVWALGFGGTGEAITDELFVQTPGVFEKGGKLVSRPYAVNVFDVKMVEAGEIFRAEHENHLFLDPSKKDGTSVSWSDLIKKAEEHSAESDGMPAPVYAFHKMREEEGELYRMKKEIVSADGPDVITISTGDDYRNITYANVISRWLVNERTVAGKKGKMRYLVVSVFNKDNNYLVSAYLQEKTVGCKISEDGRIIRVLDAGDPFLCILIVNNLEDVYSFKTYEERTRSAVLKHTTYSGVTGKTAVERVALEKIGNACSVSDFKENIEVLKPLLERVYNTYRDIVDPYFKDMPESDLKKALVRINALFYYHRQNYGDSYRAFSQIEMWDKLSNYSVVSAEPFFHKCFMEKLKKALLETGKNRTDALYKWKEDAVRFEHDRWVRLHFSNGWVKADNREKKRKQHNCILNYHDLSTIDGPKDTMVYDVLNVLWAICEDKLIGEEKFVSRVVDFSEEKGEKPEENKA